MTDDLGPWAVEWCAQGDHEGMFHVNPLESHIEDNLKRLVGTSISDDWYLVGIFDTQNDACDFRDKLYNLQAQGHFNGSEKADVIDKLFPDVSTTKRTTSYKDYLKSEHWQRVRKRALKRAQYRCQLCNGDGALDVHHRSYENIGNEQWKDIIVLCHDCHEQFHKWQKAKSLQSAT